ncbi:hotdog family protein [Geofilum rhodophaeum]|uniref:hypothetical protein n=1 Tax=Geofilum rhodophaeum TaxID=1965019 RepID=UPI000B5280DC|nr:hypothetical protein [Geofilum rhodophaeum]
MTTKNLYSYELTAVGETHLEAKVVFNATHPLYRGHFPQAPVTPGVCQMLLVADLLSEVLQRPVELEHARDVKFLSMHNPEEDKVLVVKIKFGKQEGEVLAVNAEILVEQRKVLKLNGSYRIN